MVNTSITETHPVDFNKQIKPFTIVTRPIEFSDRLYVFFETLAVMEVNMQTF